MTLLTKSKYLYGLQCPKLLWISCNKKALMPPIDTATQHLFDEGHKIGELAQQRFPSGVNISSSDFMGNINSTKKAILLRKTIFEAGIMIKGLYSRADILLPFGQDEWDIIEVKSSTTAKDVHVSDMAFQKYVYELYGLKIRKCFLMHINNKYVRDGDVDIKQLFNLADVTERVSDEEVKADELKVIIDYISMPEISIGPQCTSPYTCGLYDYCWKDVPPESVFDLYRGGQKSFDLYSDGVKLLSDIPSDFKLNDKGNIQRDCAISKEVHVNVEEIAIFLSTLKEPLNYLDFETFSSAIPAYDGVRPYQQVPFQYSLHLNGKHYGYLGDGTSDPRLTFLESLKKNISSEGSIIVYNQSFEIGRLNELAEMYPEYKEFVDDMISRIIDLIVPFRDFSYYNPSQAGSCSIKYVLPAVVGGSMYKDLDINNGVDASLSYQAILNGKVSDSEREKILSDLDKYCELDTKAMELIVEKLRELVKK